MSAPLFTSGPWWVDDRRKVANALKSGGALQVQAAHRGPGSSYCVAIVHQWEAPEANARLIAAAPELYEALASLCDGMDELDRAANRETFTAACAALAKARGQ